MILATLALVFVIWLAAKWVASADKPKRGSPRIDLTTGRITGVGGGWGRALIAAGAAYLLARWQDRRQDRRDLVLRAEEPPGSRCARCGRRVTEDAMAGLVDARGNGRCLGHAPHTLAVPDEQGETSRAALPF